jgi:hypothetical protein
VDIFREMDHLAAGVVFSAAIVGAGFLILIHISNTKSFLSIATDYPMDSFDLTYRDFFSIFVYTMNISLLVAFWITFWSVEGQFWIVPNYPPMPAR